MGDQAIKVLLFKVFHLGVGFIDQLVFRARDDQIILTKRNSRHTGVFEAKIHQPVGENDRVLLAAMTIDNIDHVRDLFFGQNTINGVKRHHFIARQDLEQFQAAWRHFHTLDYGIAIVIDGVNSRLDFTVQCDGPGL